MSSSWAMNVPSWVEPSWSTSSWREKGHEPTWKSFRSSSGSSQLGSDSSQVHKVLIYSNSVLVWRSLYSYCPNMTFWNFLIYKIQIQRWITVYIRSRSLKYSPARKFPEEIHDYGEHYKYGHVHQVMAKAYPWNKQTTILLNWFDNPIHTPHVVLQYDTD